MEGNGRLFIQCFEVEVRSWMTDEWTLLYGGKLGGLSNSPFAEFDAVVGPPVELWVATVPILFITQEGPAQAG